MLVYLDESAANEQTINRQPGWALFGISPTVIRPVHRSERHSFLTTHCQDGILALHIHQGATSGARFEWFLREEVLPRCNAFPGPKSVLIMDKVILN